MFGAGVEEFREVLRGDADARCNRRHTVTVTVTVTVSGRVAQSGESGDTSNTWLFFLQRKATLQLNSGAIT